MVSDLALLSLRGKLAAHSRWARTPDRSGATAPARRGFDALWGGKTPSVSVGPTPQVAPAPSERHRAPIPDPRSVSTLLVIGRYSAAFFRPVSVAPSELLMDPA